MGFLNVVALKVALVLQIFFPCLLEHRWVCYVWRIEDNSVLVFDPSRSFVADVEQNNSHSYASLALRNVLKAVAEEYFIGWHNDWDCFKTSVRLVPFCGDTWLVFFCSFFV